MELSADQLKKVREWAANGQSLSDIQKHMEQDFDLHMTYMQMRFMLDDYEVVFASPKVAPAKAVTQPQSNAQPDAAAADGAVVQEAQETELAGGVTVDVDRLNRPGAVASGSVTFSDGVRAKWYLDQTGRLGLDGVDKTYRPTPEDVQDFQTELQGILQKKGY
jgi:hypothetical protein